MVSAQDLWRRYGEGEAAVDAARGRDGRVPCAASSARSWARPGSGKSTLMHCLAGLDKPTSGSVEIDSVEITTLDDNDLTELRREKIGFIFQAFNLLPVLTAEENIVLPLTIAGRDVDREWVEHLIGDGRPRRPPDPPALGALRRPAAAGRDRACAGDAAGRRVRGRADRQPRLERERGGSAPAPRGGRPVQADGRDGDPRRRGGLGRRPPRGAPGRQDRARRALGPGRGRARAHEDPA